MKAEEFMPEYIMLIGLPARGKSTWIRQHMADNPDKNYKIVSSDDIIEEWGAGDGIDYKAAFDKYSNQAMKEMNRRFKEYVENGDNIIHDQTNMSIKSRKGKIAKAMGYRKIAVTFSITDAEWQRRSNKRAEETGKRIPEFVIKKMANSYQAPSKTEGFEEIITVRG